MAKKIFTMISLFAGCGGSSLGYHNAGFSELLAVDWDTNSIEVFKLNFPDILIWQKDIRGMKGSTILRSCKVRKHELDILDSSPPCQGFSILSRQKVNDRRNDLVLEFIRLVDEIQPKTFLMENVPGMIQGKVKGLFKYYTAEMKKLNYVVKCKLMNAMYYQVPQSRERLIWIGVRKDLKKQPVFPIPNNKFGTVREALKGVKPKTFFKTKRDYTELFAHVKPGFAMAQCVPKEILMKYAPRFVKNKKLVSAGFGTRLFWHRPAFTICKTNTMSSTRFIHPDEDRVLSIEELKRIATFPDSFKFTGTARQQWARIGNAVPPKFMEAIAKTIKKEILS